MDDISYRVRHVIADVMWLNDDDVKDYETLKEDLGVEQGEWFDIQEGLIDEFGVDVSENDAEGFDTVGDVVKFVRQKVEG